MQGVQVLPLIFALEFGKLSRMIQPRFAFRMELWPWIRALLALGVVLVAVFVWNPHFIVIAPHFPPWMISRDKNAVCVIAIGLTVIGCVESLRKRIH